MADNQLNIASFSPGHVLMKQGDRGQNSGHHQDREDVLTPASLAGARRVQVDRGVIVNVGGHEDLLQGIE